MSALGELSLWVALVMAGWATILSLVGAVRARPNLVVSAERAVLMMAVFLVIASAALWSALVARDFTVSYVAYNTSLNLPTAFALTAFWAAPAGSLLLYALLSALLAAGAVLANRSSRRAATPFVTSVLAFVVGGLVLALLAGANPFVAFDGVTSDGRGLTPQLQHRWAAVHPPLVYLGLTASLLPFAGTIGALITRRLDAHWLASTQRWMLLTWSALTGGLLVGMRWAYLEEGWGGFWAWDVVQNSALLPWLASTAFLHTAMLQSRRPSMRVWNTLLSLAPFLLALLGSYMARSGVTASLHAFVTPGSGLPTKSSVWMLNLLLIALVAVGLLLLARRATWSAVATPAADDDARAPQTGVRFDRETMIGIGTLALLATTVVVLWGTLFPLLSMALKRESTSLGAEFYTRLTRPIAAVAIVALVGSVFAPWRAPASADRTTRRRIAAWIAHGGVIAVLCACGGALFARSVTGVIRTGDVLTLQDAFGTRWSFTSQGMSTYDEINRQILGVSVAMSRSGRPRGMLASEQRQYLDVNGDAIFEPTTETGVRTSWLQDVRLVFLSAPERDAAVVRLTAQPLVVWLWIGGAMILLSGVLLMWPAASDT